MTKNYSSMTHYGDADVMTSTIAVTKGYLLVNFISFHEVKRCNGLVSYENGNLTDGLASENGVDITSLEGNGGLTHIEVIDSNRLCHSAVLIIVEMLSRSELVFAV